MTKWDFTTISISLLAALLFVGLVQQCTINSDNNWKETRIACIQQGLDDSCNIPVAYLGASTRTITSQETTPN